ALGEARGLLVELRAVAARLDQRVGGLEVRLRVRSGVRLGRHRRVLPGWFAAGGGRRSARDHSTTAAIRQEYVLVLIRRSAKPFGPLLLRMLRLYRAAHDY